MKEKHFKFKLNLGFLVLAIGLIGLFGARAPVFGVPQSPGDWTPRVRYPIPERLVFDISWAGMKAGQAVLEIIPGEPVDDVPVFKVISTARSNEFISMFYPVKDTVESVIDAEGLFSYGIVVDQNHGSRKKRKVIRFDQEDHRATLFYKNRETEYEIPPKVHDSLSSFYYFRTSPELEVGKSIFIDVHESKKNFKMEVRVLGRETLATALGKIPTVKVKAIVRFEGILYNKGDVEIWVTDDNRRIPVLMKGKARIGAITAKLVEAQPFLIGASPGLR